MDDSRDTLNNSLREEVQQKLRQAKDLLKRVRDKDFCSGMKNSLVRIEPIILNSTIRLKTSTLLEVRKILEKGVQKTTSKLVLERYNANVPAWDTTDLLRLSGQSSRPNSHQEYSSMGNQERLALKYPRRKIGVAGHSSTSNDPGNTASRSSSPLFRRRHEVFPSQPIPTTYAEHKRLSQNQQFQQPKSARDNLFISKINNAPVETDNQSINKIPDSTSHSPTHVSVPNETRYDTDKSRSLTRNTESSFDTDVPTSANSPTSSHAVHVEKRNSEFSDHRDFKDPNSVDSGKTSCANDVSIERRNSEYSNLYKDKKYTKERKDSKDRKDSKERKNSKERQDSKERKNSKESTSANSTTSNHVDADNRPQKVQSDTHTNGVNRDAFEITTTSCSPELHQQTESMEDVPEDPLKETAKVTNALAQKSSTSKPSKPKSKGHSRELHDLLSYTTEIMPKIVNRRKSISNETAVINAQLRAQFNITKELVVALTRVQTGVVAHRTRSKSIDSTKFLERRKVVEQITPETNTAARKIQISDTKEKKSVDQRKHKKSPEKKKSASSTSNSSSSSRMLRQTARKSSSKPETSASKKKTVEKKLVIESATTEIDKTPVKPKNISKKREIRSRSPSPSRPKRLRSSQNNSIVACKEELMNKSSEETEDEESSIILSNLILRENSKPNNDPRVHCHSDYMEECCLCSYKGENMVQHYVYNHPKKSVYISRVAPEQADLIKADPLGINGEKITRQSFRFGSQEVIKFRCYFCDLYISESQELWIDHISGHTGEYRYKCVLCPTVARSSIERVMHHAVCSNPSIQLWHKYSFENNHLYGYMCDECNFVQVLYENMVRHLREDHAGDGTQQNKIIRFSLVNFSLQDNEADLDCGIVKLEPILDDTKQSIDEQLRREMEFMFGKDPPSIVDTEQFEDCIEEKIHFRPTNIVVKQEKLIEPQQPILSPPTTENHEARVNNCVPVNGNEIHEVKSIIRLKRLPGDILSIPKENSLPKISSNAMLSSDNFPKISSNSTLSSDNFPKTNSNSTVSSDKSSAARIGNRDDRPRSKFITSSTSAVNPTKLVARLPNGNHQPILPHPLATVVTGVVQTRPPVRILNGFKLNKPLSVSQPPVVTTKHIRLPPTVINGLQPKHQPSSPPMAALKPWNGLRNAGKLSLHKLTTSYLLAEFKCTVYDCGFHSETLETMKEHFLIHQKPSNQHSITRFSPWLECWYCRNVATSSDNLLEHVQMMHKHCGYQCDQCCYRSRDPNSVVVHQRKYHNELFQNAKILCVPGRQKPYTPMDDDAIRIEMKTNVKGLHCSHCVIRKFIDLDEFLTHISGHNKTYIDCHVCTELVPTHTMEEHIKLHNIYLFQCVYCDYGTTATAKIMEHVADEHPERMLFYHTRVSRNNFPPFVRGIQRIAPNRYVVCSTQPNEVIHIN